MPDRRTFVKGVAGIGVIGLAGCIDTSQSGEDGHSDHSDHDDDHGSDDGHDDDHSDNHDHEHNHTLGEPEPEIEVQMTTDDGEHFVPHVVHIELGGTVTWVLESGSHDTTAYHPDNDHPLRMPEDAEPWKSDLLSDGEDVFEWTFDDEGIYDYVCSPHESVEMLGRVIVGWPDNDDEPALEPPQDELPESAHHMIDIFNRQTSFLFDNGNG